MASLKHFLIVGAGFAFILGWLMTILVNQPVGMTVEGTMGHRATETYEFALALTLCSIALIGLASMLGNRFFVTRRSLEPLTTRGFLASTAMFVGLTIVVQLPSMGDVIREWAEHLRYYYAHPGEKWRLFSLPLLRLFAIPGVYYLAGRHVVATGRKPGTESRALHSSRAA